MLRLFAAAAAALLLFPASAAVQEVPNRNARATYTVEPVAPRTGQPVAFDASGTTCSYRSQWSADNCVSYTWDDDADASEPLDNASPLGMGQRLDVQVQRRRYQYVWLTLPMWWR